MYVTRPFYSNQVKSNSQEEIDSRESRSSPEMTHSQEILGQTNGFDTKLKLPEAAYFDENAAIWFNSLIASSSNYLENMRALWALARDSGFDMLALSDQFLRDINHNEIIKIAIRVDNRLAVRSMLSQDKGYKSSKPQFTPNYYKHESHLEPPIRVAGTSDAMEIDAVMLSNSKYKLTQEEKDMRYSASENFVEQKTAESLQLNSYKLKYQVNLYTINGDSLSPSPIDKAYTNINIIFDEAHQEKINLIMIPTSRVNVILGLPWLINIILL
ncbi:hypothetical protein BB561_005948 [Smittium simulii]|uniref:Uncharacterized protein n=1 Tax=Smittium simulii TaxID=133385 RepID=A0A2T9Y7C9_9FUNG|nr:hypothetical protein BB561_005948 [Smittium simulii]